MNPKPVSGVEWFTFLDWTPLPSRITPNARRKGKKPDVFTICIKGARAANVEELGLFKIEWSRGAKTRDAIDAADKVFPELSDSEKALFSCLEEWMEANPESRVAASIDLAGLISIAISLNSRAELDSQSSQSGLEEWKRELTRIAGQPDSMALIIVSLLQAAISEARAEDGALALFKAGSGGVAEVKPHAAEPVPVDPSKVSIGTDSASEVSKRLLSTAFLFDSKCEKPGPGGASSRSASPEAFVSLSTRYGAVVDRTLLALSSETQSRSGMEENADQRAVAATPARRPPKQRVISELKRVKDLTKRYFRDSLILIAVFLVTTLVIPVWWPSEMFKLTKGEHAAYFTAFFFITALALAGTFGVELATVRRKISLPYATDKSETSPQSRWNVFLRKGGSFIDGGLSWAAGALAVLWLYLGRIADFDFPDPVVYGLNNLNDSAKAAFWALPLIGMASLKTGYDNLSNRVVSLFDGETRLKVLSDLEASTNLAQRFAVNIKAAFSNYADATKDPKPASQLSRLLNFENAKSDIGMLRGKIKSEVESAKTSFNRASFVTAALGFLLVQQGVLGKFEPKKTEQQNTNQTLAGMFKTFAPKSAASYYSDARRFERKLIELESAVEFHCRYCSAELKGTFAQFFLTVWGEQVLTKQMEEHRPATPTADAVAKAVVEGLRNAKPQLQFSAALPEKSLSEKVGSVLESWGLAVALRSGNISRSEVNAAVKEELIAVGLVQGKLDALDNLKPPYPQDFIDAISSGVKGAFRNEGGLGVSVDLEKKVQDGVAKALTDAGLARKDLYSKLATLEPLKPDQFREAIRTAVKEALNDNNIAVAIQEAQKAFKQEKELQSKLEGFLGTALKKSFSDSGDQSIAAVLNSMFAEQFKTELKVKITSLKLDQGNFPDSLAKAVLAAQIPCPGAKPGASDMNLAACLGVTVAGQMPKRPEGSFDVASHVPVVPKTCGTRIGSMYFYKPNSAGVEYCHFESGKDIWRDAGSCDVEPNFEAEFAAIEEESIRRLDGLFEQKHSQNPNVLVAGLADSRGRPEQNMSLSSRRATLVKSHLLDKFPGMKNISAIGRGEEAMATVSSDSSMGIPAENPASRRADVYICK